MNSVSGCTRNPHGQRKYFKPLGTIGGETYQDYIRPILNARGNGPGFPNEYRYTGKGTAYHVSLARADDSLPECTQEKIDVYSTQDGTRIRHIPRKDFSRSPDPLQHHEDMVYDVPFDEKHQKRVESNLTLVGLAALLLGFVYYAER